MAAASAARIPHRRAPFVSLSNPITQQYFVISAAVTAMAVGHSLSAAYSASSAGSNDSEHQSPRTGGDFAIDVLFHLLSNTIGVCIICNAVEAVLFFIFLLVSKAIAGDPMPTDTINTVQGAFLEALSSKVVKLLFVLAPLYDVELLLWIVWLSITGCMLLITKVCTSSMDICMRTHAATARRQARPAVVMLVALTAVNGVLTVFLFGTVGRLNLNLALLLFAEVLDMTIVAIFSLLRYYRFLKELDGSEWPTDVSAYVDTTFNAAVSLLRILHAVHMWIITGFSISVLDLYLLLYLRARMAAFMHHVKEYRKYAQMSRFVDALPDASTEQLAAEPSNNSSGLEHQECCICLQEMLSAKKLPSCPHVIHRNCLWRYLLNNDVCPACRVRITHGQTPAGTVAGAAAAAVNVVGNNTPAGGGQPHATFGGQAPNTGISEHFHLLQRILGPKQPAVSRVLDDVDADSEEIESEVNALQMSASLAGVPVDRFDLVDARKRAMLRRARRDYLRLQRSQRSSDVPPAAHSDSTTFHQDGPSMLSPVSLNSSSSSNSVLSPSYEQQAATSAAAVVTPSESVEDARRKRAEAARRRMMEATSSAINN